jgi:hypothetical protein
MQAGRHTHTLTRVGLQRALQHLEQLLVRVHRVPQAKSRTCAGLCRSDLESPHLTRVGLQRALQHLELHVLFPMCCLHAMAATLSRI